MSRQKYQLHFVNCSIKSNFTQIQSLITRNLNEQAKKSERYMDSVTYRLVSIQPVHIYGAFLCNRVEFALIFTRSLAARLIKQISHTLQLCFAKII